MRWIAERLAEQAFGRHGIAQRQQQKVDSGTGGIDDPVEVTPTALDSNIGLVNPPGFVGRLKMTPQSHFQFGTVSLHPTPDRRVIRLQTALGELLFDIAQRERVAKIPADSTKNQLRRRLPPLEDCRSGCGLGDLFSLPASSADVATHPPLLLEGPVILNDWMRGANRAMCVSAQTRSAGTHAQEIIGSRLGNAGERTDRPPAAQR